MKRIVLVGMLAVLALGAGLLTACAKQQPASQSENAPNTPVASESLAVATPNIPARLDADKPEAWLKTSEENPLDDAFRHGTTAFAYQSAAALYAEEDPGNSMYSPLSLYYALALATQGAAGQTADEMKQALQELPYATMDTPTALGNLFRLLAEDPTSDISLANSLWLAKENAFEQSFLDVATQQFYASLFAAEFGTPETDQAIGAWIAENTGGTITPQVETEASQLLAIINTIHFKGAWMNQFDPANTMEDTFHTAEGDVTAEFMSQKVEGWNDYFKADAYERATLFFEGGTKMTFVLPAEGEQARDMLTNEDRLKEAFSVSQAAQDPVDLTITLPKASFNSTFDLIPTLKKLGVEAAFGDTADFSNLTETPAYISSVKQESFVSWDENGAEASAYTNIGISKMALMPDDLKKVDFRLDRPFLFQIATPQDIPLFIGICENPAEEA